MVALQVQCSQARLLVATMALLVCCLALWVNGEPALTATVGRHPRSLTGLRLVAAFPADLVLIEQVCHHLMDDKWVLHTLVGVAALHSTCSRRSTRLPRLRGTSRTSGAVAASLLDRCPWQRHSCCGHWWRGGRRRFFSTTSLTDDGAYNTPPSDPSGRLLSCSAGRTRARQAQELFLAVHLLLVATQSPSDLGSGSSTE